MNVNYSRISQDMGESLVEPVQGQSLRPAATQAMIEVTAPASLPEGYEFDAQMGNRTFKVKVPPGGVEAGQRFSVPMPEQVESMISGISVPVGEWRDGFCDCFHYGVCHPTVWTALLCPLIAAGQVISRLQLNWYGAPASINQATGAFQILFLISVVYYVMRVAMYFAINIMIVDDVSKNVMVHEDGTLLFWDALYRVDFYVFWLLSSLLLFRVRMYVREKYAIRGNDAEDCCLSFWCYCCVGAQMLRHTTDYDTYPATCCTERGIPKHAPSIV